MCLHLCSLRGLRLPRRTNVAQDLSQVDETQGQDVVYPIEFPGGSSQQYLDRVAACIEHHGRPYGNVDPAHETRGQKRLRARLFQICVENCIHDYGGGCTEMPSNTPQGPAKSKGDRGKAMTLRVAEVKRVSGVLAAMAAVMVQGGVGMFRWRNCATWQHVARAARRTRG